MAYFDPNNFYFGTIQKMQMIPAPVRGLSANPAGWGSTSTFLNGGAVTRGSFDSHKTYDMEWRGSTAPEVAQLLKTYSDGTYGRGLIYFQDPSTYFHNVLPARWADPSMALGYEGRGLVYGVEPEQVPSPVSGSSTSPVQSVRYDLSQTPIGYRGDEDSLFIPVPRGHDLYLGVSKFDFPAASVRYLRVGANGVTESGAGTSVVDVNGWTAPNRVNKMTPSDAGVRLFISRDSSASSKISLTSLTARILPSEWGISDPRARKVLTAPWVGGMGHSGVQFDGKPSWVTNTAAFGGQISTSASFIETGDWYFG